MVVGMMTVAIAASVIALSLAEGPVRGERRSGALRMGTLLNED
jgi:hypothetical protein